MPEENSPNPFANIPPSPTVEVRTLHSDVQSMSDTGGVSMQVEEVREMISRKSSPDPTVQKGSPFLFRIIVLILVILIAALAVGFIINMGIFSSLPSFSFLSKQPASSSSTLSSSSLYVPTIPEDFDPYPTVEETRFFRIPADAETSILLSREAAHTAEDLLTFSQKLQARLNDIPVSKKFIEVNFQKDGPKPADALFFMSFSGIQIIDPQVLEDNFFPNITAFVYRDRNGEWPGYIFKLLPGKNQRAVASEVQLIERSPVLSGLFLEDAGNASGSFESVTRLNIPIRFQNYTLPGAVVSYGWEDRYFIISTSLDGMTEALRRLRG